MKDCKFSLSVIVLIIRIFLKSWFGPSLLLAKLHIFWRNSSLSQVIPK